MIMQQRTSSLVGILVSTVLLMSKGGECVNSPSFCNGLECAYFNSTSNQTLNGNNIEFRYYPSQYWISETIIGEDWQTAIDQGFNSCFDYISGENENATKIDMTAPVTNFVNDGGSQTNYTVSFYVPYNNQVGSGKYPPLPTQDDLFVNQVKSMNVAVLSFGGFGDHDVVYERKKELTSALDSASITYDKTHWFFAGYDAPFQITNRHNEVWVRLEN